MGDWQVGLTPNPGVELAVAVGASSAFPPVLSPVVLNLNGAIFASAAGATLQKPPFTERVVLNDGGVYDNLGLEAIWKRYKTILVSDAGGKMPPEPEPKQDWVRHSVRVLEVIDNQVRSLRKRQLIESFKSGIRLGTYWGVRTNIQDYGLPDAIPCSFDRTTELASTPTRLAAMPDEIQERLINWGYAVCDAALRKHVDHALKLPKHPPYSDRGV
jgi:NTE family protein